MPAELLLLPSPLLPATAYSTFVDAVRRTGWECRVADASDPRSAAELVERWAPEVAPTTRLLAHSNAGYLAPGVRADAGSVHPIVFMDAALPPPVGTTRLAPAGLRARLAGLVDASGLLPPWTQWWPRESMLELVPQSVLESLEASCPRLPLRYFDTEVEAPTDWAEAAHGYLAFGGTYGDEVSFARSEGWPVIEMEGRHLEFVRNPDGVAAAVAGLLRAGA